MNDKTIGLDRNEEELLISGISDEALEIAAGTAKEKANYAKHGVHFADAVGALEDEQALTEPDASTAE